MGRRLIALLILVPLLGLLGVLGATRLTGLELPTGADGSEADPASDAGTAAAAGADAAAGDAGAESARNGGDAQADAAAPRPRETLRVIGMGWELLVPGVLANGGTTPTTEGAFGEAGIDLHVRSTHDIERVEAALAQGGDEDDGAHIAVLSLPAFVAAYERLRALEPQVFLVVAWSRGRDAVYATGSHDLRQLPRRNTTVQGKAGTSATLTSLFMLEHAGMDLDRVRISERSVTSRLIGGLRIAEYLSVDRGAGTGSAPPEARILATTADASELIPYVAIAPAGFLESDGEAVTTWTRSWLAGVSQMQADVPQAARTVAAIEGAPEPVALLRRVGQIEFVDLGANARILGLSGRGAVTLEALFQETWGLWRGVSALTTPAPDAAPMSTGPVISLVLAGASAPSPGRPAADPDFDTDPIIERTLRVSEDELVSELGLLAGVFERSAIEVGFRGSRAHAERVITQACNRYDLPANRFRALRGGGRAAKIILHAAP